MNTKEKILIESFKLFCQKPYTKVTFNDIEKSTKLSRGAILYYFPNKLTLFQEVINHYVFELHRQTEPEQNLTLLKVYKNYLRNIESTKKFFLSIGIQNMHLALVHITLQSIHFYDSFIEKAKEWEEMEYILWKNAIENGIFIGELKDSIDIDIVALLFKNVYLGTSYSGIIAKHGFDLKELEKEFNFLYNIIKKKT